ncbi:hypothetical protein [Flavobacterium sp. HJSW_4]|uniref:hypothetical protein n=1 Tax=Flavobacterium sp. HJSW_4 TaxID=3344660 RepID=UPI0035F41460
MKDNFQPSKTGESESKLALFLAVLAIVLIFIPYLIVISFFLAILVIIFGAIGLSRAKKANAPTGLAKIGLGLGIGIIVIPPMIYASIYFAAKTDYVRNKVSQSQVEAIQQDIKRHRDSVNKNAKTIQDTLTEKSKP